jgi:hypothetical protein
LGQFIIRFNLINAKNRFIYLTKVGLVNHFFDGQSFEDINLLLDSQLGRLSEILTQWAKADEIVGLRYG